MTTKALQANQWEVNIRNEGADAKFLADFSDTNMTLSFDTSAMGTETSNDWEKLGGDLAKSLLGNMKYEVEYTLKGDTIDLKNDALDLNSSFSISKKGKDIIFTNKKQKDKTLTLKPLKKETDKETPKTEKQTEKSASSESTEATTKKKNADTGTYKDQMLDTKDGTLKITGFEKGTDYNGSPMFYLFFDLTNKKETAENIHLFFLDLVDAEQNTGSTTEKLNMAITSDSPYQDKLDLLQKNINPGATIQGGYAYKFADETKPVKFIFNNGLASFDDPVATEEFMIK